MRVGEDHSHDPRLHAVQETKRTLIHNQIKKLGWVIGCSRFGDFGEWMITVIHYPQQLEVPDIRIKFNDKLEAYEWFVTQYLGLALPY